MRVHCHPPLLSLPQQQSPHPTTTKANMKSCLLLCLLVAAVASAFTVVQPSRAQSALLSGPEEEEEGLDLNLEEMFTMFDAADNEEEFDESIKKVKSSEE